MSTGTPCTVRGAVFYLVLLEYRYRTQRELPVLPAKTRFRDITSNNLIFKLPNIVPLPSKISRV